MITTDMLEPTLTLQFYKAKEEAFPLKLPNEGDVGFDLVTPYEVTIYPSIPRSHWNFTTLWDKRDKKLAPNVVHINTGIRVALPSGAFGWIAQKSSISAGNAEKELPGGLIVLGGIIDNGYRGDIIVALANVTMTPQTLPAGTKIAQMILMATPILGTQISVKEVASLEALGQTTRGEGGFGSTGLQVVADKPVLEAGG